MCVCVCLQLIQLCINNVFKKTKYSIDHKMDVQTFIDALAFFMKSLIQLERFCFILKTYLYFTLNFKEGKIQFESNICKIK